MERLNFQFSFFVKNSNINSISNQIKNVYRACAI